MPPCFDNADSVTFRQREKLVVLLGRTDTGKTSTFNLMTGLSQPTGNRISSTTRQCLSHANFIDTPGFGDTRGGEVTHHSLTDFFISLAAGIDVLLYFVRYGAMNSTDLELFLDIYKRMLSTEAYSNSCLVISDYSPLNLEQVNIPESDARKQLLKQLNENDKYAYILEKFDNRVIFIDVSPYDCARREMSKEILRRFLSSFQARVRFNCQNLRDAYRLIRRTQEAENLCLDIQNQNEQLITQNQQLTRLYEQQIRLGKELEESHQQLTKQLQQVHEQSLLAVESQHVSTIEEMKRREFRICEEGKQARKQLEEIEREMERSVTFNVVSYIPLMHIVTNIIELHAKRRITQRIRKLLHSKKKGL